jgi:thioredoxin
MKKLLFFLLLSMLAIGASAQRFNVVDGDTVYVVQNIDQDQFKELIADWGAKDWVMRSERPAIIDFYADWCAPCKRLEPRLRQIAQIYNGEVDFYRVDVDDNPDIAAAFQIRNIPCLLICPLDGEPKTVTGLYPLNEYIRVFNQALGK